MIKQIYEIDVDGFLKEIYVGEVDENFKPINSNMIGVDPDYKLHLPRWNGADWVEGETEEMRLNREYELQLSLLQPSPQAIEDSEFEIKVITLLQDLEVI